MEVFVVVLLIFVTTGDRTLVQVALARECGSPSHKFHGMCTRDSNCANIWLTEGFKTGKCVGIRHRCFCYKNC
ncbi:hypothetical protein BRADI_1g56916v3 [Brachypodium distachyon]|uniref:Knottins-like domain-containing protein n=1 Tax=Brachypodium distachyon TaxID=15368 RepID=A0A2K2DRX7_BRADI|nr:hypothetical protein BRADI_1g56916v3 [Brachypodium distachyon]